MYVAVYGLFAKRVSVYIEAVKFLYIVCCNFVGSVMAYTTSVFMRACILDCIFYMEIIIM